MADNQPEGAHCESSSLIESIKMFFPLFFTLSLPKLGFGVFFDMWFYMLAPDTPMQTKLTAIEHTTVKEAEKAFKLPKRIGASIDRCNPQKTRVDEIKTKSASKRRVRTKTSTDRC